MARPLAPIDGEQVVKLAGLGLTQEEIAGHLGCAQSTISERFRLEFAQGRAESKMSLRRAQWKSAMKGSVPMLIHLGKHYLGQTGPPPDDPTDPEADALSDLRAAGER